MLLWERFVGMAHVLCMGARVFEKGGKEEKKRDISLRKGAKARRVSRNVPTRRWKDQPLTRKHHARCLHCDQWEQR